MNLVADESVDRGIVVRLREDGFRVIAIAEESPGIDDDHVLRIAQENPGILITADKDFGELAYRFGRIHHGIVLIRLSGITAALKPEIVSSALAQHGHEMSNAFTVISSGSIRIRRTHP